MLLNLLTLLLIFLVGAYLGNQGILSATLALITATFASIFAGTMFEPLSGPIARWRPEYARGLTFLLLFFLVFSACRIAADFAVPKNIRFSKIVDRSVGGVLGFVAALVIIGSMLIGIQMLPLGTEILGYDRFPGDSGMQGDTPGVAASGSNIWLAPDNFTLLLWDGASGRALGGNRPFDSVHPNLLTESYGYRQTVQPGVTQTLPPNLLSVPTAWMSADAAVLSQLSITEQGKAVVVVRAQVTADSTTPKNSVNSSTSDGKQYFFITPSEVRLVTDKGRQYYPIGYLDKGRVFNAISLSTGQLAEDFPKNKNTIYEDWVFETNSDEKPQFLEMKELARVSLTGVLQNAPVPPAAMADYSPHDYEHEQSTLAVHITGLENNGEGARVFVLAPSTDIRTALPLISPSYKNIVSHLQEINSENGGPWTRANGHPGVPGFGDLQAAHRILQDFENKGLDDRLAWHDFLPYLFDGQATVDGPKNLVVLPQYFDNDILPVIRGPALIKEGKTDSSGKLELTEIPKGSFDVVAEVKTDHGFYFWAKGINVKPKTTEKVELKAPGDFSAVIK